MKCRILVICKWGEKMLGYDRMSEAIKPQRQFESAGGSYTKRSRLVPAPFCTFLPYFARRGRVMPCRAAPVSPIKKLNGGSSGKDGASRA